MAVKSNLIGAVMGNQLTTFEKWTLGIQFGAIFFQLLGTVAIVYSLLYTAKQFERNEVLDNEQFQARTIVDLEKKEKDNRKRIQAILPDPQAMELRKKDPEHWIPENTSLVSDTIEQILLSSETTLLLLELGYYHEGIYQEYFRRRSETLIWQMLILFPVEGSGQVEWYKSYYPRVFEEYNRLKDFM